MTVPENSRIVLDGQTGCVGRFTYLAQIAQEGEGTTLDYECGMKFRHAIPADEFRQLWETIQACDPLRLKDDYENQGLGLGDFSGTLSLEWQSAGQTFHKAIQLGGTNFLDDPRMQKLYDALNAFLDAHYRMENERIKK